MTVSTQFEASPGGIALSHAILLYQPEGNRGLPGANASAFASLHKVEDRGGRPTIAPGVPLRRAHLRRWTEALGRAAAPEILPDNVLVAHPDVIAWWTPEQVRPAYFALISPPSGLKALASRTTAAVPYPAHLFVATRAGLGVYALRDNLRPTSETVLLHSPVLNVFINGQLCWGDVPKPKGLTVASIVAFERAVFDSWSTHPNPGQEHTLTGRGGLVRLWDDLAARGARRFPAKRLKPFNPNPHRRKGVEPITFGQLVAGLHR